MIEPNSGGHELSREEQANFAVWEYEMQRVHRAEKAEHTAGYLAASAALAVQGAKDWVTQNEVVRRAGAVIFAGMVSLGRTMNPGLYLATREQHRHDNQA